MSNAPLRYTLAMLRFPKVLSIERFVGAFQDQIRSEYPHLSDLDNQGYEVTVGDGGAGLRSVTEKFWQFSSIGRDHALILGSEFLVLHAGRDYGGHADLIGRFARATEAFRRVDGLGTLMTALGYRYIDLVVPRAEMGESLAQYLRPWAMPTEDLELTEGLSLVDSAHISGFRTPRGVLRFQALRRPPNTLPPELDTQFVRENGWVEARPEGEFALLDIDHASVLASPLAIDPGRVADELAALRAPAVELFYKAVTPHALQEWNRQA
jgi:uncharacterized protein (TIGR04255 family)